MNHGTAYGRQRGVALVVALIMLLAVTLIAVSASNLVQSNLKIVQNMESRDMVRSAAHSALEEAISSGRFMASPDAMFAVSCEVDNQRCYDFNGDGTDDVTVAVAAPTCVVVQPIKNSPSSMCSIQQPMPVVFCRRLSIPCAQIPCGSSRQRRPMR